MIFTLLFEKLWESLCVVFLFLFGLRFLYFYYWENIGVKSVCTDCMLPTFHTFDANKIVRFESIYSLAIPINTKLLASNS